MGRSRSRAVVVYATLSLALWVLLGPLGLGAGIGLPNLDFLPRKRSSGNTRDYGIRTTSPDTNRLQNLKLTRMLSHAAGFSVIENLYWYNQTYFFLTDQPWHFPDLTRVANWDLSSQAHSEDEIAVKIWNIWLGPVSPEVQEKHQLGSSISLDDAEEMFANPVVLDSPMMINNDPKFINHMYHWLGETFLGAWRVWSNYAYRTGLTLPNFKTVAFIKAWTRSELPPGTPNDLVWDDLPGANKWFTEKFFPGVTIEDRPIWEERAESGKIFLIPMAVIADRRGGHWGPSAAWKPWGDVLRLPVSSDWLVNLRDRVLENYAGPFSLKRSTRKPKLLYLSRQSAGRSLRDEDHDHLVIELQKLHDEGLVDYEEVEFDKSIPFQDQVAKISTVDILVAVHGNGLTHTLWMSPGGYVFEMQPAGCTVTDYSPLAITNQIQHYMVHETTFCTPRDCPKRGCEKDAGINSDSIPLTPSVITNQIRLIVAGEAENEVDIPIR